MQKFIYEKNLITNPITNGLMWKSPSALPPIEPTIDNVYFYEIFISQNSKKRVLLEKAWPQIQLLLCKMAPKFANSKVAAIL